MFVAVAVGAYLPRTLEGRVLEAMLLWSAMYPFVRVAGFDERSYWMLLLLGVPIVALLLLVQPMEQRSAASGYVTVVILACGAIAAVRRLVRQRLRR